jgi:hypothetical protein
LVSAAVKQKSKIDRFVLEAACSNISNLTAPYVSRNEKIDIDTVRTRLLQLRNDDKLIANYDIICPECFDVIQSYHDEKNIPLGKKLFCDNSENEVVVELPNILVSFTPNKEYYTDDMCNKVSDVKKKLKLRRKTRRV